MVSLKKDFMSILVQYRTNLQELLKRDRDKSYLRYETSDFRSIIPVMDGRVSIERPGKRERLRYKVDVTRDL